MSVLELTPPHSVEAEQGVLGGLMLDNAAWDIVGDLQKEDFFRHEHRLIFTAISELAAKDAPFDVVTVSEAIEDLPEAGGLAYLGQLADNALRGQYRGLRADRSRSGAPAAVDVSRAPLHQDRLEPPGKSL